MTCPKCFGHGKIFVTDTRPVSVTFIPARSIACSHCNGTGQVEETSAFTKDVDYLWKVVCAAGANLAAKEHLCKSFECLLKAVSLKGKERGRSKEREACAVKARQCESGEVIGPTAFHPKADLHLGGNSVNREGPDFARGWGLACQHIEKEIRARTEEK